MAQPAATLTITTGQGEKLITAWPATVNLRVFAGDDFTLGIVISDGEGDPLDLTGATARAHIRETVDADLAFEFAVTVNEPDSLVLLHLQAATSAVLPPTAVYDCEINIDGTVTTLIAGTIITRPEVTR